MESPITANEEFNEEELEALTLAAEVIKESDAIVFTNGAGLGVDSGLPDFRGPQGFWKAYPPMAKLGLQFSEMSNPSWFQKDPAFAWGFWLHRYDLYSKAIPHRGYYIMKEWAEKMKNGYFVFTSNVDGAWTKTGIPSDHINECHGSVHYLQCTNQCSDEIWDSAPHLTNKTFNHETFRADQPLPLCKNCNHLARTNVLMFGDGWWISNRQDEQQSNFNKFLISLIQNKAKLAIVEIGAGKGVPTVRYQSENLASNYNGTLIRINPTDNDIPLKGFHVSIPLGGMKALIKIDELIKR